MDWRLIFFKFILLTFSALSLYLFIFKLRSRFWIRFLLVCSVIVISTLILIPAWSTQLAGFFGIGRGVDFLFYLSHGISFFCVIVLYVRIQSLQSDLTKLIRENALQKAQPPK